MKKEYSVYKHTAPNGKVYIGITSSKPEYRWRNGKGYSQNVVFGKAIQKYGWNNFEHEILYSGLTKEEAEQKEVELIKLYKSDKREYGYNLRDGGGIHIYSEESKRKMSEAQKGKKLSIETRNKMSIAHKGRKPSEQTIRASVQAHKGKKLSIETREKLSISHKGQRPWNKGKSGIYSIETRQKLSESHKGKNKGSSSPVARKIYMLCKTTNEVLKVFECISDASEFLNVKDAHSNICAVCNNRRKTAYGYKWSYAGAVK